MRRPGSSYLHNQGGSSEGLKRVYEPIGLSASDYLQDSEHCFIVDMKQCRERTVQRSCICPQSTHRPYPMTAAILVSGFSLILWSLYIMDRRARFIALELMKLKGRQAESDRRLAKRLYELTFLLRNVEERIYDIEWAVVPLKVNSSAEMTTLVRTSLHKDRERKRSWVDDPSEVLPSDVDPSSPLKSYDWKEIGSLQIQDFDGLTPPA